jgi:hypothetical protein
MDASNDHGEAITAAVAATKATRVHAIKTGGAVPSHKHEQAANLWHNAHKLSVAAASDAEHKAKYATTPEEHKAATQSLQNHQRLAHVAKQHFDEHTQHAYVAKKNESLQATHKEAQKTAKREHVAKQKAAAKTQQQAIATAHKDRYEEVNTAVKQAKKATQLIEHYKIARGGKHPHSRHYHAAANWWQHASNLHAEHAATEKDPERKKLHLEHSAKAKEKATTHKQFGDTLAEREKLQAKVGETP